MMETWKDIKGYEGKYQVSNMGKVRNILTGNLLSAYSGRYSQVHLGPKNNQKTVRIHRLVAEAFIPNPDNLPLVNHKDENKMNNCVDNLEWCTALYNLTYGSRKGIR